MKRVFLLSLGLILGLAGFAQERVNMKSNVAKQSAVTSVKTGYENPVAGQYAPSTVLPSVTNSQIVREGEVWEENETMVTQYDLQSNSAIGNRIAVWEDGAAAVVATWDGIGSNTSSWPDRGTGYNFFDGSSWDDMPEARIESSKTGWPTICAYGDGEILANHSSSVNVFYRPQRGTGDWTQIATIGTDEWTWPRVACTEDGTLQLICCQTTDVSVQNIIGYFRSTDGGHTWTQVDYFTQLYQEYNMLISADDYVMAVNGNDVAVLFNSAFYDIFYVISHDAGATWEKQVVASYPVILDWNNVPFTDNDTIWCSDNSGSIAIGNDGTVHVAFGLGRSRPSNETVGSYNYWPYTVGIVYWNSNYTNEQGGHNIPDMGQWSGDAAHPEWALNGEGGINNTLCYDRLVEIAWEGYLESGNPEDINPNLNIFGWASELEPGSPASWSDLWDNNWGVYRTIGISTLPVVAVDDDNVVVFYNSLSDARVNGDVNFYYRSAFMHRRVNGVWMAPNTEFSFTSETANIMHLVDEIYSTFGYPNAVNGAYWFAYSADTGLGLFLDSDQTEVTDNTIYVLKLTDIDGVADNTKDVVYNIYPNPATDYICISSEAAANATITFVNLAGQTVKSINKSLAIGPNNVSIDLESGVYFCTVTANGFSKTTKVVVK